MVEGMRRGASVSTAHLHNLISWEPSPTNQARGQVYFVSTTPQWLITPKPGMKKEENPKRNKIV